MSENNLIEHSKKWDRTGIIVSSLCMIHCLTLPFLVAALPMLESFFHNTWIEISILATSIFVGSISFFTSYRKHKIMGPMVIGFAGVIFLLMTLSGFQEHHDEGIEWTTIIGGTLLVIGHVWNIRSCACYCDNTCHHPEHHHSHKTV